MGVYYPYITFHYMMLLYLSSETSGDFPGGKNPAKHQIDRITHWLTVPFGALQAYGHWYTSTDRVALTHGTLTGSHLDC